MPKHQPNPISGNKIVKVCVLLPQMEPQVQEETLTLAEVLAGLKTSHRLILWNDNTNTFEHVIHCLIKYLDYSEKQAEAIAWTVHNDGKCIVLEGSFTEIEVYRKILQQEGLTVSIE